MSDRKETTWDIGEFCTFEFSENKEESTFLITLKGDIKFSELMLDKVDEIRISQRDLDKYVEQ